MEVTTASAVIADTMTTTDLSVGILGVGNIGTVHLQSAQSMAGVTVTAAADAAPAVRGRARQLGVDAVYPDYAELLEQEPVDAVVVALPPGLHATAVEAAVDAGCHAFVEKPFATTVDAAERMVTSAQRAGVSLGVDHTVRYHPEIRRLKERYDQGALGHVPLCVATRINDGPFSPPEADRPVPEWQIDPDGGGHGAVLDLGVHLFDVLEWFFGPMEVRHAAMTSQLELPFEDTASVQLQAEESGTFATLNCGFFQWETPPEINLNVRLEGVAGTAESRDYVPEHFPWYAAKSAAANLAKRVRGESPDCFKPTYYYQAHYRALHDFLTAVADGREPPVSGREGLRTVELADAAYRAAGFEDRTGSEDESAGRRRVPTG